VDSAQGLISLGDLLKERGLIGAAYPFNPWSNFFNIPSNYQYCFISQSQVIEYKGDPLQDFTLMRYCNHPVVHSFTKRPTHYLILNLLYFDRFLDRFIYKNPKKKIKGNTAIIKYQKKNVFFSKYLQ
jgi:hypothetical protein